MYYVLKLHLGMIITMSMWIKDKELLIKGMLLILMLFTKTVNWNTNNIYSLETDLLDISITYLGFLFFFLIFMIADQNIQVKSVRKKN